MRQLSLIETFIILSTNSLKLASTTETLDQNCLYPGIGNLIQPDKTIRAYQDQNYCLVHYGTRRSTKFYWRHCEQAASRNYAMHFTYEAHDNSSTFGYLKTVEDEKCLYIYNPKKIAKQPPLLMRHCKHGNEKLQWEIGENSMVYKLGNGKYCVPFEKNQVARVKRCWTMALGYT